MKMIVGLGNPGKQFDKTRHNAGFYVLDLLAEELKLNFNEDKRHRAALASFKKDGTAYLLVKPLTFMNLSGEAVFSLVNYYHIDHEDIIIIHDDLDLPIGKIRLRTSGSSGGQKGMRNIMELLNTQELKRIRIGISNDKTIKDYVLTKIKAEEWADYDAAAHKAKDALVYALDHPFNLVMNKFNG